MYSSSNGNIHKHMQTRTQALFMEQPYWSIRRDLILCKVFSHIAVYSASGAHIFTYSERVWRCVKLPNGIIDLLGLLLPSINQKSIKFTPLRSSTSASSTKTIDHKLHGELIGSNIKSLYWSRCKFRFFSVTDKTNSALVRTGIVRSVRGV